MVRWIAVALLVLVAALGFVAWKRYSTPPQAASSGESSAMPQEATSAPAEPAPAPTAAAEPAPASGPGVDWTVPAAWVAGPPRPMRLATYAVGDAECAVFYFGPNQGGAVDDNIERWRGQFKDAPLPKREERKVHGMKLTRVEIDGTFLSPGTDMQSQGSMPGWRMLGAIVQGPQGPVFFKFTGPVATVRGAAKDFDALLASLTGH
jgi:hypothetical protein